MPILSKLLEKIVFEQVQDDFSINDLTTKFQHAYRSAHSTCTAMTQMSDSWLTSIDNSMLVGTLLLDFSAAFDVINHEILISKLISYGFTSSAIKWFKSYLSESRKEFSLMVHYLVASPWIVVSPKEAALDHCCFRFLQMICHIHSVRLH